MWFYVGFTGWFYVMEYESSETGALISIPTIAMKRQAPRAHYVTLIWVGVHYVSKSLIHVGKIANFRSASLAETSYFFQLENTFLYRPTVNYSIYQFVYLSILLSTHPFTHPSIYIYLSVHLSLSVCLSVCLSIYLSYLSIYLSILPLPPPIHPSISTYIFIHLPIYLFLRLCVHLLLSICQSIYPSICLSTYLPT